MLPVLTNRKHVHRNPSPDRLGVSGNQHCQIRIEVTVNGNRRAASHFDFDLAGDWKWH